MRKPLSSKPAKPKTWISLPGYPTLAAAGLSLCLSSAGAGCSEPAGTIEAPYKGDAARDVLPSRTPDPAGGISPPFQPDPESAPDALPPPSAADADQSDSGAPIDEGLEAGAASPDATAVTIDPGNMAGGEPYLFIPDAGDETNN